MPQTIHNRLHRIAILDDYSKCVRTLDAFQLLDSRDVTLFHDSLLDEDALVKRLSGFDALVVLRERTPLGRRVLSRLPALRLISAAGSFPGSVDLHACRALGIAAAQSSGVGAATAELCWALVLASRRFLVQEAEGLRAGFWQRNLGRQLQGQTLGIWGYGRVGRQVARFGHAFGMRVLVWGSENSTGRAIADGYEVAASKEALFTASDVLSLHLKLVDQTMGIVTPSDLELMKPDALLVNTARAELIAPGALLKAVRSGRPGFAAIDVFEKEPFSALDEPLLKLPNVLATPHIGYVERENFEAYYCEAFTNLLRYESGDLAGFLSKPGARLEDSNHP